MLCLTFLFIQNNLFGLFIIIPTREIPLKERFFIEKNFNEDPELKNQILELLKKPGSYLGFTNENDGTSHVAIITENLMLSLDSFLKEKIIPEIKDFKKSDSPLNHTPIYSARCPICFVDFNDNQEIAALPCGHILCQDCANHSLSYKKECPCCRAKAESFKVMHFDPKTK